ncbi:MAG: 1-deoxy-D-xylulose-5-phosphate synthase [Trueperella sp.]|nr:1-deoxy-D-xylulose-5-phosphate synthase [Trueperella sp.]
MSILDSINGPADLRRLNHAQLDQLAGEIRSFLVENVAKTGGHLGPNLGVVELTIALHRVFNSPADALIFDTGHQAYVHKILTGRKDFSQLRQEGGLSGYPARSESPHDIVENSHATTALSWADGVARGFQLAGKNSHAVAVIGDGAFTGGMAWEALNNIGEDPHRPIIIVLNDNGRSYAPTVGGIVRQLDPVRRLDNMRVNMQYENVKDWVKRVLQDSGVPGKLTYEALHGFKTGMRDMLMLVDAGIFDFLGVKYIGPVNGHDIAQLEEAFHLAADYGGPIVVHCITEKGRGYAPAEKNAEDHFHAVGQIHPETGLPVEPSRFGWTSVFAKEIVELARKDSKLIGITAAMMLPVGLGPMKRHFPSRVIDVGIAEAHAMTMAAGLAHAGYHPVLALYATFMNRSFDQLIMDVGLHHEAVTICLDRSGITGDDGASHNGIWDFSIAAMVPGLRVAAPRDGERLRLALREATAYDGPTLVRYPKGSLPAELAVKRQIGELDVLFERQFRGQKPLIFVGVGAMAHTMVAAAQELAETPVVVVDPRWVLPVPDDLVALIADSAGAVVLEDGLVDGGIGTEIVLALHRAGHYLPVETLGVPREYVAHATRQSILQRFEMTPDGVIAAAQRLLAGAHR